MLTVQDIEAMGKKSAFSSNVTLTQSECQTLKEYAISSFAEKAEKIKYQQKYEAAVHSAKVWKQRFEKLNKQYEELKQKAQPFFDAMEIASEKVWDFLNGILALGKSHPEKKQPTRNKKHDMEI